MNKIIAVVGMCGSGKSVACEYLESIGYQKVYFGGVTMEKLKEANMEVNPENEKYMREKLRSELGMGAFAKVLLPKIKELSKISNVVLDGLYSWEEYKILSEEFNNLILLSIIVDKPLRYRRLSTRDIRPLSNEEAMKRDISEIENIQKAGPIAYADYYVFNNGSVEDFNNRLKDILEEIK
jgi:dephospho-CoA kinase